MEAAASWSSVPERGALLGIRTVLFTLNTLGYRVASSMLLPIVSYFFATGRQSRGASLDYLRRLHRTYPHTPAPTLRESYLHHLEFAQQMLERLLLWQGKLDQFTFNLRSSELLQDKCAPGALLLGAHLGSFDALRALAFELPRPVHVVMFRSHAPRINRVLREINPNSNLRVIELVPGDMNSVLELKESVARGEHVAVLADRLPPGPKPRSCLASFLGQDAPFPQSPWILANALEAPVHFVTALRTGPRAYSVLVEPLVREIRLPRKQREQHLKPHVGEFARRLERLCVESPRQWFNFYDFWSVP